MAGTQPPRHQKRSRASDAAEKASRAGDERVKRRRTSDTKGQKNTKTVKTSDAASEPSNGQVVSQNVEKRKGAAPWSFSRPVGGRYSNLDPIITADEA